MQHRSGVKVPVIGLAGGIGAGKSRVARMLGELGCLVLDSDAQARAELESPEVKAELVRWWGPGVLDESGRVDRAAVAGIVFARPEARRSLEGLIHPRLKARRAEVIERAGLADVAGGGAGEGVAGVASGTAPAGGVRAVVVDAPLLFEAGVNKECDAVIFVEAPVEVRLGRLARSRGWDAAELARRESAQWPLEQKRVLSDEVIQNSNDDRADEVKAAVESALVRIERRWRIGRSSEGATERS